MLISKYCEVGVPIDAHGVDLQHCGLPGLWAGISNDAASVITVCDDCYQHTWENVYGYGIVRLEEVVDWVQWLTWRNHMIAESRRKNYGQDVFVDMQAIAAHVAPNGVCVPPYTQHPIAYAHNLR